MLHDLKDAGVEGEILLSSHQVLFLILRGDERYPRERLGHDKLVVERESYHDI